MGSIYQNLIRIGLLITTTLVNFLKLKANTTIAALQSFQSKMKTLLALLLCLACVNATTFKEVVLEEWETWKVQHGKEYKSELENNFRMKVFMDNRAKIARHNTLAHQGLKSYTQKLNEYSDMLSSEFNEVMNGYKRPNNPRILSLDFITQILPAHVRLPENVDWRDYGAVTDVKNQGACGSCWAFSTTGALEGQHFRKTGKLVSLSEQNLIDCTAPYGEQRCKGGSMDVAFQYIKENGGIDTEESYPYVDSNACQDPECLSPEPHACRFNPRNVGASDKGFVDITEGDEDALKAAVATIGPVSVGIHASDSWQHYHEGVFDEEDCNGILNHGVLVVGYGTNEEGDYWLVKNSWGKTWGDQGYIKMSRNKDNQCFIASSASYPVV